MVVSIMMVAIISLVRALGPPLAPRVHVRWADAVSDAQRLQVEKRLALVNGQQLENRTWQYDLMDVSPSSVRALIDHPSVEDTHHIDRVKGVVNADAPSGTARFADSRLVTLIRSPLFDWVLSFWIAALAVSGAWLVSADRARRR